MRPLSRQSCPGEKVDRMNGRRCADTAPNLLCVCVNSVSGGDYRGTIWNQYQDQPEPFDSTLDLLKKMERVFNILNFPQNATVPRSFGGSLSGGQNEVPDPITGRSADMKDIVSRRGDQGTFIVQVKYRQNSTWQGEVIRAEKNKRIYFRSALELLRIMDSALTTENDKESPQNTEDQKTGTGDTGSGE